MDLRLLLLESLFACGFLIGLGGLVTELLDGPFLVSLTDPLQSTLLYTIAQVTWLLLLWHGRQRTKGLLHSLPVAFPLLLPLVMAGLWVLQPGTQGAKLAMGVWSIGLAYSFPSKPWDHLFASLVFSSCLAGILAGNPGELRIFIILTGPAWFFIVLGKYTLFQVQQELTNYERARTVAAEFVAANMRLQDMLYREGVNERNNERQRVAREVHDTIGHTLTALLVQISLVKELTQTRDEGIRNRLITIESMMRTALQDMRMTVSGLRDESIVDEQWHEPIHRLCNLFSQSTSIKIICNLDESIVISLAHIKRLLYRLVQEGITNAYRHGNATVIDVSIGLDPGGDFMVLRISDNGNGSKHVVPGNGMRGMMERLKGIHGTLRYQTKQNRGFDLGVTYPVRFNTQEPIDEADPDHSR